MININMLVFIGIISQVVLLEKFRGIFVFWRLMMVVKKMQMLKIRIKVQWKVFDI